MKDKKKTVKIDPCPHFRVLSVAYLFMGIFFCGQLFGASATMDYVIFSIVGSVCLAVSVALYCLCPIRVMTDGRTLYIRNTVNRATKAWTLSDFCAVYLFYDERRLAFLIFSSHEMGREAQEALCKRAHTKEGFVAEHNLVCVRTDKLWKRLIPKIEDAVPFYAPEDGAPVNGNAEQ